MIDDIDRRILTILQANARMPNAEIARQLDMAPSGILERIRRLEERGVIQGYETRVDPRAAELGLTAFVFVRSDEKPGARSTTEQIAALPEVIEAHHIAGDDCFLVKVRARDTEALGRILRERIGSIPGVRNTRTTIVLDTLKETVELPLAPPAPARKSKSPEKRNGRR